MKNIVVLGSTGSVGVSTLDVVALHADKYAIYALSANSNVDKMLEQCLAHSPKFAVMADANAALTLEKHLKQQGNSVTEVLAGSAAIKEIVQGRMVDSVMVAIVGAIGLEPSMAAVKAGKQVLIANKEPLVMAGDLFTQAAKESAAIILPIDSEHNAIFQCLPYPFENKSAVTKLILTASGGPFRGQQWSRLKDITPEQAIAHPNWSMGPKISVDSATMMNKGLELIEATHLFAMPEHQIDILIHQQSIIHSLVEYADGSQLAQLGSPDMKIPIAYSLAWPNRQASGAEPLNLAKIGRLDFVEPDFDQIPCLSLAKQVAKIGGTMPAVMNAANEIAVEAFINKMIGFTQIADVVAKVTEMHSSVALESIEHIIQVDIETRQKATELVASFSTGFSK